MNSPKKRFSRQSGGFTLIELLTVISIIGVLAGLLLPTIGKARIKAQVASAKNDLTAWMTAIMQYQSTYGRFPATRTARESLTDRCPDFTYGTQNTPVKGRPPEPLRDRKGEAYSAKVPSNFVGNSGNEGEDGLTQTSNAELTQILRETVYFKGNVRTAHGEPLHNPQKELFLNAKDVGTVKQQGIGPDRVFRDPWGNPYIITLDLNYDNQCRDGFYRMSRVSAENGAKGFNGLYSPSGGPDDFEARVPIMVWSFGPDGRINPGEMANLGANKDNVLSWK